MTLRDVTRGTTFMVPGIPAVFECVDAFDPYKANLPSRITEKYPNVDLMRLWSILYGTVKYDCPVAILPTPNSDADAQAQTEKRPKRVKVTRVKR